MNKIKKLIFTVIMLVSFNNFLQAIDEEKVTTIKINTIIVKLFRNFLITKKVAQPEIENIIQHFDNFQESIPCSEYQKAPTSIIDRVSDSVQKALFGYSWQNWKTTLKIKSLRAKEFANHWVSNPEITNHKPAIIPKNIDIKTELIPHYDNVNIQNLLTIKNIPPDNVFCDTKKNNNIPQYMLRINPAVTEQCPESLPFRRAYLLAQIERDSLWIMHRNLALAKIAFGVGGSLLAYYLSKNFAIAATGCLTGILAANLLKEPIAQRERAACIQRAKQLIGSDKEFSFKAEITTPYPKPVSIDGENCNISAVKFKISQVL